jgi:hypothetical protein
MVQHNNSESFEVVKIASKDFNKELSGYIGKRRVKPWPFGRKTGIKKAQPKPAKQQLGEGVSEVEIESKQPGMLSRVFSFRRGLIKEAEKTEDLSPEEMAKLKGMEDDIEDTEEKIAEKEEEMIEMKQEEEVLVEKRENMVSKFMSRINFLKKKQMEAEEQPAGTEKEEPVLEEDVIEVIKIAHKWLGELTPGKKRGFKESEDFKKYKAVLQKYGIAKEKKE